ncbi:phosphotransferase enzyme family protein [Streptomyces cellostaticus]|uniref:phosphotransferase enzyme family protein n=1 Tax=Streptomyces cellostaticus TaxID=67285 RepID=UPI002025E6A8|nr:aminoglycoside phosphotransferase family protein [Streptomyces cellostaticus]
MTLRSRQAAEFTLADGPRVTHLRRLSSGRSHAAYAGRLVDGSAVVCKVSAMQDGRLPHEGASLAALTTAGYPCPEVVALGRICDGNWEARRCLVLRFLPGGPPTTGAAFTRLGRRLAELHQLQLRAGALPVHGSTDPRTEASHLLTALTAADRDTLDEIVEAIRRDDCPAVPTHGDAGPGNYLDTPSGGTLIDFETAAMRPALADIGRCLFLMEVEYGMPAASTEAQELIRSYRNWRHDATSATDAAIAAWCAVEGLRVTHWRHENRQHPRTPSWNEALNAVNRALRRVQNKEYPLC